MLLQPGELLTPVPRYNPFRPGGIVAPGMFAGRLEEVDKLEQILFQTKAGNPSHFLIHGERGIGKSSLLFYLQKVADGTITSTHELGFRLLTINVELEPANRYEDIIRKVGSELHHVVATQDSLRELLKSSWDFLKRWEVMGVKYSRDSPKSTEPHELLNELTRTVAKTAEAISLQHDGILILIDEADKPPASANLGEFAKVFTERLTKTGCTRVSLGLAGLPSLLTKLRDSHQSAPRIFDHMRLDPLLPDERVQVLHRGLEAAKETNGFEVTIAEDAARWIADLSEGYPHFIQQFAWSAFERDTNNIIEIDDAAQGAFGPDGAFEQLGMKYFHDLYFAQIGSDEYRSILYTMSDHFDGWVTKDQIRKESGVKETKLTNGLAALKQRNIILTKEGERGVYRLPTRSFAVWIKAMTHATQTVAAANGRAGIVKAT